MIRSPRRARTFGSMGTVRVAAQRAWAFGAALVMFIACAPPSSQVKEIRAESGWELYGQAFPLDSGSILTTQISPFDFQNVKTERVFAGEIVENCSTLGCWMNVLGPQQDTLTVYMQDHAFFLPTTSLRGRKVVFSGFASLDTLSAKLHHHLALREKRRPRLDTLNDPLFERVISATGIRIEPASDGAPILPQNH